MHLLDYTNILKGELLHFSDVPAENMKYHILKFREEGLADLYYLLRENRKIGNLAEAKRLFAEKTRECRDALSGLEKTDSGKRDEIFGGHEFYDAGPLLVIDMMCGFFRETDKNIFPGIIRTLEKGEPINQGLVISAIKNAFFMYRCMN
jgi:hypothetical protein